MSLSDASSVRLTPQCFLTWQCFRKLMQSCTSDATLTSDVFYVPHCSLALRSLTEDHTKDVGLCFEFRNRNMLLNSNHMASALSSCSPQTTSLCPMTTVTRIRRSHRDIALFPRKPPREVFFGSFSSSNVFKVFVASRGHGAPAQPKCLRQSPCFKVVL
jgi:hypothetical protein